MEVSRHPVDIGRLTELFRSECGRLAQYIELARSKSSSLDSLADLGRRICQTGSVVAPDAVVVAQAMRVSSQCNTAIFLLARPGERSRLFSIGDRAPITYSDSIDESLVHPVRWTSAYFHGVISRQSELVKALCAVSTELLRQSSTRGEEPAYQYVDFLKDLWTKEQFSDRPAFRAVVEDYIAQPANSARGRAVRVLGFPFVKVLTAYEKRSEEEFKSALVEALQGHKKYWGATEKRRNDLYGVVSVQLAAIAALAWDRGMRFDVESDYIPTSWVRGHIFQQAQRDRDVSG